MSEPEPEIQPVVQEVAEPEADALPGAETVVQEVAEPEPEILLGAQHVVEGIAEPEFAISPAVDAVDQEVVETEPDLATARQALSSDERIYSRLGQVSNTQPETLYGYDLIWLLGLCTQPIKT